MDKQASREQPKAKKAPSINRSTNSKLIKNQTTKTDEIGVLSLNVKCQSPSYKLKHPISAAQLF